MVGALFQGIVENANNCHPKIWKLGVGRSELGGEGDRGRDRAQSPVNDYRFYLMHAGLGRWPHTAASWQRMGIDDVSFRAVPEPGSALLLLAAGLAVLIGRRRQR